MKPTSIVAVLLAVVSSSEVAAFSPAKLSHCESNGRTNVNVLSTNADAPITPSTTCSTSTGLSMSSETDQEAASTTTSSTEPTDTTESIVMPLSFEEMVKMTAMAMEDAYSAGITRQSIRVLLPRDPSSGDIGLYFENDAVVGSGGRSLQENLVLVPPDETWQGGSMQLYRAAAPTVQEILRRISKDTAGVPPRMVEDRSVDESGVDGIGLWMSQSQKPADDVSCFVQPSQETIDSVDSISQQAGDRLVVLMNPQWRMVDDALDAASKKGGVLGGFASFLGGKGNSLKRLEELGFKDTMTIEGYVCRGGNIRLVKRFDSDWCVFAENDSATEYIRVGTSKTRPSYQDVDSMLQDKGISLKYARDVGLAPKL